MEVRGTRTTTRTWRRARGRTADRPNRKRRGPPFPSRARRRHDDDAPADPGHTPDVANNNTKRRRSMLLGSGLAFTCPCCGSGGRSERTGGRLYDRYLASALSQDAMASYEKSIEPMKRRLFGGLAGSPNEELTIVELGVGAAPNARYYCDARRGKGDCIVAVDKNQELLNSAASEFDSRGVEKLELLEADVADTGLPSAFADAVVGTLLLCSVRSQDQVLREIRRILKPGGKYYFVEHVAAPSGTPLRTAQDLLSPLQRVVAGGCNLNRNTEVSIAAAFEDGDVTSYRYDVLPGEILFDNGFSLKSEGDGLGLLAPHISGEATAGRCVLTRCLAEAKV
ncbi:methyltransferase [Chloropicon roscoffensis]|uniref:Methyltransferase n=1 Tax=Chloropicon roscoffensis TaxID=1461544 RepID=A0AAX4PJT8_9CHLO